MDVHRIGYNSKWRKGYDEVLTKEKKEAKMNERKRQLLDATTSCQGQSFDINHSLENINMLLLPTPRNAPVTNAIHFQWWYILFKTFNLFNFHALQIDSHIRISCLFLSTFLPSSSPFVFYATISGFFSSELT